jgi:sugar O-acyltransferase (sialic acid O-acetyltransferase NeuD family)
MSKAYIYGNGGHARVIASFLNTDIMFLVPDAPRAPNEISQTSFEQNISSYDGDIYIGIGDNAARTRIFDLLSGLGRLPSVCIAPTAFVARDAVLSPGAVICAGAVIGSGAHIGLNTIVNTLSNVDHDCVLGDHSQVTAGVTIGGSVHIGKNCFFGVKSAVIPGISIGDNAQVMAGSLVTKPVPSSVLVGGSPAKVVRNLA